MSAFTAVTTRSGPLTGSLFLFLEAREAVGLVLVGQLVDEIVDVAIHAPLDVREVVRDAFVGDAVLRVVVGARLLGPLAASDLRSPRVALLGLALLHLVRQETRPQDGHGLGLVLQLRALVLAGDDDPGRQ